MTLSRVLYILNCVLENYVFLLFCMLFTFFVSCGMISTYYFPLMTTDFPCHNVMLCLTAQKIETVERKLQVGAKHIEAYYEVYLERHVDVSTMVDVVKGRMVVVLVMACISIFFHYILHHTCLSNLLKTYLYDLHNIFSITCTK